MKDFLAFRTMVTPVIIQILFWAGTLICIIVGAFMIIFGSSYYGSQSYLGLKGVLLIVLGPLAVRIYCEILIIFFRINETLTEIKHALGQRPPEA
jgi:hypothetical protein